MKYFSTFLLLFFFIIVSEAIKIKSTNQLRNKLRTRVQSKEKLKVQDQIKLRVRAKLGIHLRAEWKSSLRNTLRDHMQARAKDQAQDFAGFIPPPGPIGDAIKAREQANPMNAISMSSSNVQSGRNSDWEYWEDLSNLPKFWFVDICDLKREAETLFLQCSDADDRMTPCYGGEIHQIVAGFYGAIIGECPSVSHTWKCVKEVGGVIYDDKGGKYKCKDAPACTFEANANDFKLVQWSTWMVNGIGAPFVNHFPNLNDCEKHQEQKLAVVASCKCGNPLEAALGESDAQYAHDVQNQDVGGSGGNGPMASDSRSLW